MYFSFILFIKKIILNSYYVITIETKEKVK